MIWIYWIAIICVDALLHRWMIEEKKIKINHIISGCYRILLALLTYAIWSQINRITLILFMLGAFFTFWLIFNLLLNLLRGLPFHYLGTGSLLDRLEKQIPFQAAVFWKACIAAGMIYGYYHPELL